VEPGFYRNPTPLESQESLERKRRHTAAEHERRQFEAFMRASTRSHTMSGSGEHHSGHSRDTAIDLTSSPSATTATPSRYSQSIRLAQARAAAFTRNELPSLPDPHNSQRSSEIGLPQWQADADASHCPVCENEFTFWYRKHHCRKCGRVVCATCSPHRITIPRQYIVQPPNQSFEWDDDQEELSASQDMSASSTLGGGEIVRVCNPCVPDPWTPESSRREQGVAASTVQPLGRPHVTSAERQRAREAFIIGNPNLQAEPSEAAHSRYRSYSHQPGAVHRGELSSHHMLSPHLHENSQENTSRAGRPNARYASHRHTFSSGHNFPPSYSGQHGYRRSTGFTHPLPPLPPAAALPRRQVKEEDECPVCGEEMPPGEAMRAEHIQDCIANRFSSTPPRSAAAPPPPTQPPPSSSSRPAATTSTSLPTPSLLVSRPRAPSYRPRGMAVYLATEKDCTSGEGELQECVICFEEFQPGDELGRMECLCKFHRTCIRQWWDTKGTGSCPTHQLHE
jgi:hypothetical protein